MGLSGSPKKEKSSTKFLLQQALEAAEESLDGVSTEILDVSGFEILPCTGCDSCVRGKLCPESAKDDIPKIEEILRKADGIIISAPSYFNSVPGIFKNFMDRSRYMKMQDHQLKDKVFGVITYAGLRYGGQELVVDVLYRFALAHGMIAVGAVGSPVKDGNFGSGSLQTDEGGWRSAKNDELAIRGSKKLGIRIAEVVQLLKK